MQGLVTKQMDILSENRYWHHQNRKLETLTTFTPSVKIRKKGKAFNTLIKTQEPFTNKIRGL